MNERNIARTRRRKRNLLIIRRTKKNKEKLIQIILKCMNVKIIDYRRVKRHPTIQQKEKTHVRGDAYTRTTK